MHIRRNSSIKSAEKLFVKLRLKLVEFVLNCLDAISRGLFRFHPVDVSFLELVLLMGDLVLATLTIDERFVHPVLIVKCGHFHSFRSIVVSKQLLHLTLTRNL